MLTAVRDPEPAEARTRARALGAALRDALAQLHQPQRWLSEKTGISPTVINRFILGTQLPTLEQVIVLADALGVSRRGLLARGGYIETEDGLIDPDAFPPGAREALRAIAREFDVGRRRSDDT